MDSDSENNDFKNNHSSTSWFNISSSEAEIICQIFSKYLSQTERKIS